jgi:cytochrome oxidase Cu insertion factor (SCO1/SenC/PrrC family)
MKRRLASLAALVIATALVAACSSAGSNPSAGQTPLSAASQAALGNPNIDVGTPLNNKPAPDFTLVNQFGQKMSLSEFRGKVVMLGFEDSECTTVCPLTTQSMVLAKELLGKAGDSVQLLGVDANPHATAVSNVLSYSRVHGMVNQWDFLTGSLAQLTSVWKAFNIAVQINAGAIDHTPALYVIDSRGRMQRLYLTQMAYSSITQSAQVLATELATLLPGHPKVSSMGSLAEIQPLSPQDGVSLPLAVKDHGQAGTGTASAIQLRPGKARLVVFFATWLGEVSNLNAELATLNAYAKTASAKKLPSLYAVDETVTEPSRQSVTRYLNKLGPLDYPVALDLTGRVADGYGVQDQPWLVLVNAAGKVAWQHDGWVSLTALEAAAKAHS